MADSFLSEIRMMSFGFPPKGWAFCNGQLLPINQNQGLFALLGTTYGGDGRTNFGLPNLQVRIPIHMGGGHTLGELGGETAHTLISSEMAQHNHLVNAQNSDANPGKPGHTPSNISFLAQSLAIVGNNKPSINLYGSGTPTKTMSPNSINPVGGNQAHENRQPFLVINFCIALQGIFPSQT